MIEAAPENKEQLSGWFDETPIHADRVAKFLADNVANIRRAEQSGQRVKRYDHNTELHFSGGGDAGIHNGTSKPDEVRVYYEAGSPIKMHLYYHDSSTDAYISGKALEDYLNINANN